MWGKRKGYSDVLYRGAGSVGVCGSPGVCECGGESKLYMSK